jgi:hypothetical protein|tara:strand:- start:66 stop:614 length:549 start_codon:yes stop_codon:yes gene_type:complete
MKNPKELFESIVNLSKTVLGNETVSEEVVLSEEVVEEIEVVLEDEVKEAAAPVAEAPVVAPVAQPAAVSKSEFDSAIAEIKEMYTKVLESISPSQPQEVPEALSEVVTEEEVTEEVIEEVELSTEEVIEEVVEVELKEEVVLDELVHDPEIMVEKKEKFLYAQNRVQTTEDVVFNSLFNNKK